ncbi:unnamed protein product [Mycena citricolor]|uniref:Endosomal/vacuolar adapter protein YPT35 n=1 Tax=Mycena citricolor TaxID=2018698 RepID=A0AAD2H5K5_9AGAR|nr:unnamed protein product [Mycena citricolor]
MSSSAARPLHPWANSNSRIEVMHSSIDVEEESRIYDDMVFDVSPIEPRPENRPYSPPTAPSVFSNDIWLDDNSGAEGSIFARQVSIAGWTSVGDSLGGAYVVYDCSIKTKDGTLIHAHKRYSDFVALETQLLRTLPPNSRAHLPALPPKSPFSRYRAAFLARRRRALEAWLCSVLLHPDIGGSLAVRKWVVGVF